MRLLADENIPRIVVMALRDHGHDVLWIAEEMPGARDRVVMQLATSLHRLLLTFDLDFGELVFRHQERSPDGIIILRIPSFYPEEMAQFVVQTLASREDWANHFSVIDLRTIRLIQLPE